MSLPYINPEKNASADSRGASAGSAPKRHGFEKGADNFAGYRILLTDDDEISHEIVRAMLKPLAIETDCAENGVEAVEMFSNDPERYDMIFMDIQMPGMNGYEATKEIRKLALPKAATIPIIALTANIFKEDIYRCLASGMDAHIGKPANLDDILKCLRRFLPPRN
ncbi:MAG: response regulator [Oscillospiraceae bacterium]|nr:response regulator [Oscillospiraceae bacterium]